MPRARWKSKISKYLITYASSPTMCNADRHQQVGTVESLHLIENYYSKSHRIVLCVQRRRRSLSNGFQNGTTLPRRVHPLNVLQFAISPYFDILILFFQFARIVILRLTTPSVLTGGHMLQSILHI